MKAYVHNKGFVLSGKAWEIRHMLKECSTIHLTVSEMIYSEARKLAGCRRNS